ncbi:MAG: dihydroneopterin aldolase [Leptolyngbyaceae cyanobacterium CSU_1_3]|nr:dihydroneopterin aldolase [Leptolyngbyaceae cyanobacterium CSU_1_3]
MEKVADCIHIQTIRAYGYTGALPEEQTLGQWFEVDLTLWLDLSEAGRSDRLQDTLNYCDIIEIVQNIVQTSRLTLLERLATLIAEAVLAFHPVEQVRVQMIKPAAPIPGFDGRLVIDITRRQGEEANDRPSGNRS